jgi:hypothetical protein
MTDKYLPSKRDSWHWGLARTEDDINDIVAMSKTMYEMEVNDIFTTDPATLRKNVDLAVCEQKYTLNNQQLSIARNIHDGKLMCWGWLKRGHYTVYAPEEMADAMFLHIDLNLPERTRITLCAQMIQQWILWCNIHQIPVLISSSIRSSQDAFLRLHEKFGFKRNGSVCYYKVENYFGTETLD